MNVDELQYEIHQYVIYNPPPPPRFDCSHEFDMIVDCSSFWWFYNS